MFLPASAAYGVLGSKLQPDKANIGGELEVYWCAWMAIIMLGNAVPSTVRQCLCLDLRIVVPPESRCDCERLSAAASGVRPQKPEKPKTRKVEKLIGAQA